MKYLKFIVAFALSIAVLMPSMAMAQEGNTAPAVAPRQQTVRDVRRVSIPPSTQAQAKPQTPQQMQQRMEQQRQRRFAAYPYSSQSYYRGTLPQQNGQVAQAGPQSRSGRMSPEDRRTLRRQINEANKGIYRRNQR